MANKVPNAESIPTGVGWIFQTAIGGLSNRGNRGYQPGRTPSRDYISARGFGATDSQAREYVTAAAAARAATGRGIGYRQWSAAPPPAPPPIPQPPRTPDGPQATVVNPSYSLPWLYGVGPRTRGRKKLKKKRAAVRSFAPSPGFPGYIPEVLPDVVPQITRVVVPVLGRVLGAIGWLFWPSRTADDDEILLPQPKPSGPPRRPVIRPTTAPAWPVPDWVNYPRPRPRPKPRKWPRPRVEPNRRPQQSPAPASPPVPVLQPTPTTSPTRSPSRVPARVPVPRPVPSPTSAPSRFDPLQFLPLLLRPTPTATRPRFTLGQVQVPVQSPLSIANPLTTAFPYQLPSPTRLKDDQCDCTKTRKRKRKSDACTNPISSKRTFTRGSTKYRTITRKLKCPASSRKKP